MPWAPRTHRAEKQPPRNRQSISRRRFAHLYDSARWRKCSRDFRKRFPICQKCEAAGIIKPSQLTDHVRPHRGNEELFWDESNWAALCNQCHNKKSAGESHE